MNKKHQNIPNRTNSQVEIRQEVSYQGPLPLPSQLQEYEKIVPGFAERIMVMAENNNQARISTQHSAMRNEFTVKIVGQISACIITMLALIIAGILAYNGETHVAGIIAGATIASVLTAFLGGQYLSKKSS